MQLVMVREGLAGLAPVAVPAGYALRQFQPGIGDEAAWDRLLVQAFGASQPPRLFANILAADAACVPERIFFITCEGVPVATASAWYRPWWGVDTGYVHYVATNPEHKGRKLGYWVSLAVLHRFAAEGRTRAVLETDDERVPAIKTYLDLGFKPWPVEEDQRQRWRQVFETNKFHFLCPDLDTILAAPIHEKPVPQ